MLKNLALFFKVFSFIFINLIIYTITNMLHLNQIVANDIPTMSTHINCGE